eukprot:14674161-Alexandrium_andersonii.AAC.1
MHRDSRMLSRTRPRRAKVGEARNVMRKWEGEFRKQRGHTNMLAARQSCTTPRSGYSMSKLPPTQQPKTH